MGLAELSILLCYTDILRLGEEAQRFVVAFGADGDQASFSLTHLAFNNPFNFLELRFGFGADSPNFFLES